MIDEKLIHYESFSYKDFIDKPYFNGNKKLVFYDKNEENYNDVVKNNISSNPINKNDYLDEYIIMYNNLDFYIIAEKFNIWNEFVNIVKSNNGEIINGQDVFFEEKDVLLAIKELKELCSNKQYIYDSIGKKIKKIIHESSQEDSFEQIKKYFFMLKESTLYEIIIYITNK